MMDIVCRCDVADWIPKIGYENMALLLRGPSLAMQPNRGLVVL
jgi:hypothetical protein